MVFGTKFYIHGGGRWREVELNDGRVEGWGKGRFVYAKRGKVQVAKTEAVLTGLQDLAAGQHSTVKDSLHLPCKKAEDTKFNKSRDFEGTCDSSRCCKHSHKNYRCVQHNIEKPTLKVSTGVQCVDKADAGIQTSQTLTYPEVINKQNTKKRRRESTSEDSAPSKITTTADLHTSSPRKLTKTKRSDRESSVEKRSSKSKVPSLRLKRADSSKYSLYKRRRSRSSDSVVWVVLPKNKENENNHGPQKTFSETKSNKDSSIKVCKIKSPKKLKLLENIKKPNQEKQKTQSVAIVKDGVAPVSRSDKSKTNKVTNQTHDQCKELIIDEDDVDLLRRYLITHDPNFDVLRFNEDDEYKKHFFFKINPLVSVERCRRIAKMLRSNSQDAISLKDFVSVLGLRSVADVTSVPKRYKMRKIGNRSYLDRNNSTDSKQTDKENSEPTQKRTQNSDKKVVNDSESSSVESDAEDESENIQNRRRRSKRLDKSLKESDREEIQEKIKTKRLGGNAIERKRPINNVDMKELMKSNVSKKLTEIFSSEKHKKRDLETSDSSKDSEDNSSKEVSMKTFKSKLRSSDNKYNLDLTRSSTDDEVVYVKPGDVKHKHKRKVIEISDSIEENSEAETNNVSKNAKRDQIKAKGKIFGENKELTDDGSSKRHSKSSKEIKRSLGKEINDTNKSKKKLKDSDEETSETDTSKSSKEVRNHVTKVLYVNKNVTVNISESDEETVNGESKTSKNHTPAQNNAKKRDKKSIKHKNHTISNREDPKQNHAEKEDKNNGIKNKTKDKERDVKSKMQSSQKEKPVNGSIKKDLNKTADSLELSNSEHKASKNIYPLNPVKEIKTLAPNAKSRRPPINMYSSLEDHAVVTWVSSGGRASCVNGNRIWRDLQDQFLSIAGQKRTWHSLRNRYLRYILPSLEAMALPIAQVSRLRAAAATGEIKSLKRPSRRNSIFAQPVSGALSRRPITSRSSSEEAPPPKRHKHDGRKAIQSSPKRVLRSSLPSSAQSQSSPRYSDITRHFATTHRHTSSTATVSPTRQKSPNKTDSSSPTKTTYRLSQETTTSKKPKLSLRRSFRNKDSPAVKSSIENDQSSASSPEKNRSSEKSQEKSRSSEKSQDKSRSSDKSQEKSRSRAKSPEKRRSRAKSPAKGRSSAKSPAKERSKTRKLFNPGSVL